MWPLSFYLHTMRTKHLLACALAIATALSNSSCDKDESDNIPPSTQPQPGWHIYGITVPSGISVSVYYKRAGQSTWSTATTCTDGPMDIHLWGWSGDSVAVGANLSDVVHFEGDQLIVDQAVDVVLSLYPGSDAGVSTTPPTQSPCEPVGTHLASPPTVAASIAYPVGYAFNELTWGSGNFFAKALVP